MKDALASMETALQALVTARAAFVASRDEQEPTTTR